MQALIGRISDALGYNKNQPVRINGNEMLIEQSMNVDSQQQPVVLSIRLVSSIGNNMSRFN